MSTRPQKRQKTEVRRTQIADAAIKVVVKYGSEHVTVRRIAQETGITEGALYRHFKSKHDILALMVERTQEDIVAGIVKGAAGRTPLGILESALRNHMSSIEQRKSVSFQVIAEIISLGDKKLNRKASEALERYTSYIGDLLSQAIEAGEIRKDVNPEETAILITAAIQGLVSKWALGNYSFNLEQQYLTLWRMLRATIVNPRQSS
ncbi:MAG TPA: TetR/AcrR family transcriptional regulator [Dehalococcoidia bacterium]|nr:TetR/AcrR family transcriptional regulator [Dehalococcoidia bacterium]